MNFRMIAALTLGTALTLWMSVAAFAHQPFCEFADLTAEAPWQVPDATISYAYFGNVYPASDVDYFSFQAEAGQSILLSLSIPAIPDIDVYSPVMAVLGPGLPENSAVDLPSTIALPAGYGVMPVPLGAEPEYWFEPFGRVYFWNYDNSFFGAPETGVYTVALWHPENEIGRYSFVIGQREVFGGEADCFAAYGEYWTPLVPGQNPYRDAVILDDATIHDHSLLLEVDAQNAPSVDLTLIPLAAGGYNVRAQTKNFSFTPQNVDLEAVPGEGHAHLYLDGEKIARIYGEWFFLESLPESAAELSIILYANDHRAFAVNGVAISASATLTDTRLEV